MFEFPQFEFPQPVSFTYERGSCRTWNNIIVPHFTFVDNVPLSKIIVKKIIRRHFVLPERL